MISVYDFTATALSGESVPLSRYHGKILLIVNTASKCGFTPQYAQLQSLYQQFRAQGFEVLGFPCNQFGRQEPDDEAVIGTFCEINYGVEFPMFAKLDVNGATSDPLFEHLKREAPGVLGTRFIKWNFTKFLVDAEGRVVKRYAPQTKPEGVEGDIRALLRAAR